MKHTWPPSYETAWPHAYGIVAATMLDGAETATIKGAA